jgi:hypothetical protein
MSSCFVKFDFAECEVCLRLGGESQLLDDPYLLHVTPFSYTNYNGIKQYMTEHDSYAYRTLFTVQLQF